MEQSVIAGRLLVESQERRLVVHTRAPAGSNQLEFAGHTLQGEEENREKEKQEERRKGELSYQVLQFNGEKQSALVSLDLHKELKT